jgi:outer membrane protein, heavy metal efflux system
VKTFECRPGFALATTRTCPRWVAAGVAGWMVLAAAPLDVYSVQEKRVLSAAPQPMETRRQENNALEWMRGPAEPAGQQPTPHTPLPTKDSTTAERVVEYVLRQHPELTASQAEINRQAGLRFQSTRRPNPVFGYAASEIGNSGNAGQQGLFLSQEFVTAGKLEIACQIGNWRTSAANERLQVSRLRISRRVLSQYWSVIAVRRRIELLQQMEAVLQEAIQINETLIRAGEATRGTLLQAQLEQNQVIVARRQAEIDLQARNRILATTLGVDPQWVTDIPSDPWPHLDAENWLGLSSQRVVDPSQPFSQIAQDSPLSNLVLTSPELGEIRALIEAAKWDVRLAEAQVISNIESTTMVQHDSSTNNVVVGLQIGAALPIRDRKTGLVQANRSELMQLQANLDRQTRELKNRWTEALSEFLAAREMTLAVQQELLEQVQQRFQLAREAFEQGEIDYLDLLTAQRTYITIQQTALDAQERAALAYVILQTLAVE